ncbi:hypothetical protein BDV98DRAFT_571607 [Pterulicium gracile]|uniref:DNA replication factor Cdt1 C-terminal domain-containing protein n=1 Tax=Pterulicium gracile TaxID=1884261 RepID=A0A5C3QBE9_9AGAR|nr:hypothetical protein BDV98DRAFT_571607 [Pterula gracilis]
MAELYTKLQVSPKKKRSTSDDEDEERSWSPKKLRIAPPTPPQTVSRREAKAKAASLPDHLSRLSSVQSGIQQALAHALATSAGVPSSETGLVRNVLNHISVTTYTGVSTSFKVEDLRRLCWIWEWDGKTLPKPSKSEEEDNPFLDDGVVQTTHPKEWSRGGMDMVLSPTSHYSKASGKREPAYGIGIEVELDLNRDLAGGTAAVARWAAGAESRLKDFRNKLNSWVTLHADEASIPGIPLADLPALPRPTQSSTLSIALANASPNSRPSSSTKLVPPSSPSRSVAGSPLKRQLPSAEKFAIPFPTLTPRASSPIKSASNSAILFPKTPSRRDAASSGSSTPLGPRTPVSSITKQEAQEPFTPSRRSGDVRPETPTTARRQALYERVRERSLSLSPKKNNVQADGTVMTREQMAKLDRDETRRRCLLGRLPGIAESVWMLFTAPASSVPGTPSSRSRKRKALPMAEVVPSIVKSSPVPISIAEAQESLVMLSELCPFFLTQLRIAGEDWLEMPSFAASTGTSTPTRSSSAIPRPILSKSRSATSDVPPSPSTRGRTMLSSADQLLTRSPKRVGNERGGIREVREIVRRELELED